MFPPNEEKIEPLEIQMLTYNGFLTNKISYSNNFSQKEVRN